MSGMSVPYKELNNSEQEILIRTANLTRNQFSLRTALYRAGAGYYSTGDYVIRSLTSSDYLIEGKDDAAFANDLSAIISGSSEVEEVSSILSGLSSSSRMYVINDFLRNENRRLVATSRISSNAGDSFENCVISQNIVGQNEVTLGICKLQGSFSATGDEIRTDFFIDGVFYQGNIRIQDSGDGSGAKTFVMAWNSDGVAPGEHQVLILLRSSDGRGTVLAGGNINVPNTMTLVNNNVQPGSIPENSSCAWYVLDAQDSNAYINFVDMSEDIRVSIYDAYGEFLGYNDLENSRYEVLRANRQDVMTIAEDTGLTNVSNTFFIKVERGAANQNPNGSVNYLMVQSREVAYIDGSYLAVIDEVGAVPTPLPITGNTSQYTDFEIRVQNMSNTVTVEDFQDITFLPINGVLDTFTVTEVGTGLPLGMFPAFDSKTVNYGFNAAESTVEFNFNASCREGNFAQIEASLENSYGSNPVPVGGNFTLAPGENKLIVNIRSFDGEVKTYTLYALIGDDSGSFCEDTLSFFPPSYGSGLWLLHSLHPEYIFTPYNTGIDFYTALSYEDNGSRSLANTYSHPGWVKPNSQVYDGGGWMAATNDVVRYFLDPRNYLDQEHIFSFECLSFNEDIQTVEGVRNMIRGSFMDTNEHDYAEIIYEAGRTAGVSPYLLASRIIQEMGYNGESSLCHGTLPGYEGYYNFYNIGSVPDPSVENGALINGARYAQWGQDPNGQVITDDEAALLLPWNNVSDAITGGALWIARSYISVGQDTLYFQKFDVISNNDGLYQHQYAQNISMAYSEGTRYFRSYASSDMLDGSIEFVIPVYTNLPSEYGVVPNAGA